jgi:nitroimidazol reductase NimA-like FMN-containing flavoprotein (pyridoxamine 5'-phosphate oxidase superfamily)
MTELCRKLSLSDAGEGKGPLPMDEMSRPEIDDLLDNALVGRLGMATRDGAPYVIPMPFCWHNDALYLRLPLSGRKGRVLSENDQVCFEVDWYTDDLSDYASVLIEGRLVAVDDLAEKRKVRLSNELKYLRLRGSGRHGHGRSTAIEEVPLSKIATFTVSGRKKEKAVE